MKSKIKLLLFVLICGLTLLLFWPETALKADDRAIFNASTKPYIMFLLDNSGSMIQNKDYVIELTTGTRSRLTRCREYHQRRPTPSRPLYPTENTMPIELRP